MSHALIGHTGFVGGNIAAQRSFDECFNSSNIATIAGREFDLLVCAGAPGAKWRANQDPAADRAAVGKLMSALERVKAHRVVLLSTVDVFATPVEVDERSAIVTTSANAYGRHRRELEECVRARFESALIVRLPGLFGPGLKKNVIFDFLNDNHVERIDSRAVFQFYDLAHIVRDIDTCLAANLRLVHFATEPVSVSDVALHAFGRAFSNTLPGPVPRYDLRTCHADTFGRGGAYIASRTEVLGQIKAFVEGSVR
ncbi:MAG: sugar nucleotide-binding protein [Planctomycetes bacterium]|nr:sugar nucleotide-binding protein [Planctomycetota bacterium]